ncbi:hypothetical protein Pelo_18947 [Pelomyxa schiedti]|nr:hypothetical protein Pelo_18947 [Pelomyxa schiedti]
MAYGTMLTNAHIGERDLHSGDQNSYVRICKLREKEAADVRHKRQQQRDSSMDSAIIAFTTATATTIAVAATTTIAIAAATSIAITIAVSTTIASTDTGTDTTTNSATAATTTPIPIAIAGPATNQSLEADTTTTTPSPIAFIQQPSNPHNSWISDIKLFTDKGPHFHNFEVAHLFLCRLPQKLNCHLSWHLWAAKHGKSEVDGHFGLLSRFYNERTKKTRIDTMEQYTPSSPSQPLLYVPPPRYQQAVLPPQQQPAAAVPQWRCARAALY